MGIRNLKLMYSRKMLYFGGVLAVAETLERDRERKVNVLLDLLSETPIARIVKLFGGDAAECLGYYDVFLGKLADKEFRRSVEKITADRQTHTDDFRKLKEEAYQFSLSLQRLLERRYPLGHQIHLALHF